MLQGGDEIPDPLNRLVAVRVTPVVTVYGLTRSFSLIGIGPFRNRRLERTVGGSRFVDESFGIEDVSLIGKYRLYRKNAFQARRVVSAEVAVKLPTGRNNERDAAGALLPPASAPGKCPITGVVFW